MKKTNLWTTFRGNNDFPIYNWFYFTESYSRGLVRNIILKYLPQGSKLTILDPFVGTGTTMLVCKEFGHDGIGIEVSPLMSIVSRAKTSYYDLAVLKDIRTKFESNYKDLTQSLDEKSSWIKKYFYKQSIDQLLSIKNNIDLQIEEQSYRDLFYLSLLKTLEIVSKAEKRGSMIAIRKVPQLDTIKIFYRNLDQYIKDIEKFYRKNELAKDVSISIHNTSVSNMANLASNVDAIICSPPYLNKTEYSRRYGIELSFLGFESNLKEHLGTFDKSQINNYLYPKHFSKQIEIINSSNDYKLSLEEYSVDRYFVGLEDFVSNSNKVLKKDGLLVVNIAGGCFRSFSIDITEYFKELVSLNGFDIVDLKIDRVLQCHKDRTTKVGTVNEFTIVCKKL